ncbi:MAG: winged helix-turn-helix transcriptional regulator [Synergistaceae bacterium]|nr:winged helix-turn-helix transcriptional regulator [Synergistaceae bacterium]
MNTLPHNHDRNTGPVLDTMPGLEEFGHSASVFAQLGDATRLRILWLLCHTRECVSDIAAALGVSKAVVSHHLQLLRRSGLVTGEREGQEIHYSLSDTQEARLLHRTIDAMFKLKCPTENNIDPEN